MLAKEFQKKYMLDLKRFLLKERKEHCIFPESSDILNALNTTSFKKIKVVILGQDPYHGDGQANGLAFSVPTGIPTPPSLRNIFYEIERDLKIRNYTTGDLKSWATQGVLLLNSTLTVRKKSPGSHKNQGWERFTNHIISLISRKRDGIIFLLWGNHAKEKRNLINQEKHYILEASHPSPLSAYKGFIGCNHFSKCNDILRKQNQQEINWKLS